MKTFTEEDIAIHKANRAKWVAALRAGNYGQIQRFLHTEGGYCCLGVLCEVVEGNEIWAKEATDKAFFHRGCGATAIPSLTSIKAIGLTSSTGEFQYTDELCEKFPKLRDLGACTLTSLNDRGLTFTEIADLIEAEPEGMFYKAGDVNGWWDYS